MDGAVCRPTGLVAAKKVKIHMTLGLAGFGLAAVMIVLGVLMATTALQHRLSKPSGRS